MYLNKAIIVGNLTRDPELTQTHSGTQVCKFTVATNKRVKDSPDEVLFTDMVAWGKQAEFVHKFFKKGKPILVEGRLKTEQWTSKDGEQRSKLVVVAEEISFVGGNQPNTEDQVAEIPF